MTTGTKHTETVTQDPVLEEIMKKIFVSAVLSTALLSACAGRDAHPVVTAQPQDSKTSCAAILAEMQANETQISRLADEKGWKVAQNVGAGALGFFTFGIAWAAMDLKGAAGEEQEALKQRNQYLSGVYADRCANPQPAAVPVVAEPKVESDSAPRKMWQD